MNNGIIEQLNGLKNSIERHRGLSPDGNVLAFEIPDNNND